MCELAMEIKRETEETIPVVSPCYFCWGWCYLLVVELSVVVVVLFVVGGGGIICWWWCGGCAVTARVGEAEAEAVTVMMVSARVAEATALRRAAMVGNSHSRRPRGYVGTIPMYDPTTYVPHPT